MDIIGIPVIIGIIYTIIELLKMTFKSEKFFNFIPIIASSIGLVLGIIGFYLVPEIMPTENIYTAILLGLCSGLSATGTNQIIKQLTLFNISVQNKEDK